MKFIHQHIPAELDFQTSSLIQPNELTFRSLLIGETLCCARPCSARAPTCPARAHRSHAPPCPPTPPRAAPRVPRPPGLVPGHVRQTCPGRVPQGPPQDTSGRRVRVPRPPQGPAQDTSGRRVRAGRVPPPRVPTVRRPRVSARSDEPDREIQ